MQRDWAQELLAQPMQDERSVYQPFRRLRCQITHQRPSRTMCLQVGHHLGLPPCFHGKPRHPRPPAPHLILIASHTALASQLDRMEATILLGRLPDLYNQDCRRIYLIRDFPLPNQEMYIVLQAMMMKRFPQFLRYLKLMSLLRIPRRNNRSSTSENQACRWIQVAETVAQQMNYLVRLSFENLQRLNKNKGQGGSSPLDRDRMWIRKEMPRLRRRRIYSHFVYLR
jgi:hypothetical protein